MTLKPLVTAAEAFPALEQLAATAEEELCLSFRIFDPMTRIHSPELRERGLVNWLMLLDWLVNRDVAIRLLIADFDPVFAQGLHRNAWRCASLIADKLGGDLQLLCAPHGHSAGALWTLAARRRIRDAVTGWQQEGAEKLTPVQRQIAAGKHALWPVTLHQKFAVADRARCVIGGLDLNERRFDTPDHARPSDQTWHDVSMAVDGHFAEVLHGHFASCWNAAIDAGAPALMDRLARFDTSVVPQNHKDIALVRTVSAPRPGARALAPKTVYAEHEKVLLDAFATAEKRVYIETQFFRHAPLAQALADAAKRAPGLNLICVLPTEPENVLFDGDDGAGARHAQALQMHCLGLLQDAFGDRLALVSPMQPWAAQDGEPGQIAGAAPIYLHSKVTIIDDRFAMVGSANLNGRSMQWDTEASVLFRDPAAVADLWVRLSQKWIGTPELPDVAATWNAAAQEDKAKAPDARAGYLLPYPVLRNQRFARWRPLVPDALF